MFKEFGKISTFVVGGLFSHAAAAQDCDPTFQQYRADYHTMAPLVDALVTQSPDAWDADILGKMDSDQIKILTEAFSDRFITLKDEAEETLKALGMQARRKQEINWIDVVANAPYGMKDLMRNAAGFAAHGDITQGQIVDMLPQVEGALDMYREQGIVQLQGYLPNAPEPVCPSPFPPLTPIR